MKQSDSNSQLILHEPAGSIVTIQSLTLKYGQHQPEVIICQLNGCITWDSYQQIQALNLFNCVSEFPTNLVEKLLPDCKLNITLLLRPDLLSALTDRTTDAAVAVSYLRNLEKSDLLVSTESWILLSVNQQQPNGEVGYRAVWDYLDWEAIAQEDVEADLDNVLLTAMADFFKDATTGQLRSKNSDDDRALQAGTHLIETLFALAPNLISKPDDAKEQLAAAITDLFRGSIEAGLSEQWQDLQTIVDSSRAEVLKAPLASFLRDGQRSLSSGLFEQLIRFFQQEAWSISKFEDQPVLKLKFQGEYGQWDCYAQANEAEQQVIFYSVMPHNVPRKRRSAIAEFITRANYGLILGNFEMDFSDGEIRYKTSIGVEGSSLDFALIRQLVYSNVLITDKYLPGIQQVIEGVSAAVAIAQIENQQTVEKSPAVAN